MRAGRLNRRVTVLRKGLPVDDGLTTKPAEWNVIGSRKAEVERARGRMPVQLEGRDPEYPVAFTFRSDSFTRTITEQDRLRLDGRDYHLSSALPADRDSVECIGVARG